MSVAIGCSKSTTEKKDPGLFTGMWIQVAYLADPGDGSGTWQTDTIGGNYIIFYEDSSAKSSSIPYFGELKSYHVLSDSMLTLEYTDGSIFPKKYTLDKDTLTFFGGCIEPCGSKYLKAPTM